MNLTLDDKSHKKLVTVSNLTGIQSGVWQVMFDLVKVDSDPMVAPLSFYAGQYLKLYLPNGDHCAYSIASEPVQPSLELHIQCYKDHSRAKQIIDYLAESNKKQTPIEIEMPFGQCHLARIPEKDLVFIAAGTGFSQIKSMVEHCLRQGIKGSRIHLYWGVRRSDGFYMPELPIQWANDYGLDYHPIVSDHTFDDDWQGRLGLLSHGIKDDLPHLIESCFYMSGSPDTVYEITDVLEAENISDKYIYSDVFEYAPRKKIE